MDLGEARVGLGERRLGLLARAANLGFLGAKVLEPPRAFLVSRLGRVLLGLEARDLGLEVAQLAAQPLVLAARGALLGVEVGERVLGARARVDGVQQSALRLLHGAPRGAVRFVGMPQRGDPLLELRLGRTQRYGARGEANLRLLAPGGQRAQLPAHPLRPRPMELRGLEQLTRLTLRRGLALGATRLLVADGGQLGR